MLYITLQGPIGRVWYRVLIGYAKLTVIDYLQSSTSTIFTDTPITTPINMPKAKEATLAATINCHITSSSRTLQ